MNIYQFRGKCKELSESLIKDNPSLRLVRGFYYEPYWNREEEHWWCVDNEGRIHDPTRMQFPSGGVEDFYREFDNKFDCSQCGEEKQADEMYHEGKYHFCSSECYGRCVGVL